MNDFDGCEYQRPIGMTLLTGLYLFLFIVSLTTYGNPFPFMGKIQTGLIARIFVFCDSLICLYIVLGIMKRQFFTWHLVICYNLLEVVNTIFNLNFIDVAYLEQVLGTHINGSGLLVNNLLASIGVLLLTEYIYRSKSYFTNRQIYIF